MNMSKSVFQTIREMMVEWTRQDKLFFNNLAKLEEETYKINQAVVNGSGDIKSQITSLFETLRSVKVKSIMAVKNDFFRFLD